jgi:hypothetical protein
MLIILEPWPERYWIQPGQQVDIHAVQERNVDQPGHWELEQTAEGLIVYVWAEEVSSRSLVAAASLRPTVNEGFHPRDPCEKKSFGRLLAHKCFNRMSAIWSSFTVGGIRSARKQSWDKPPSAPMLCHGRR